MKFQTYKTAGNLNSRSKARNVYFKDARLRSDKNSLVEISKQNTTVDIWIFITFRIKLKFPINKWPSSSRIRSQRASHLVVHFFVTLRARFLQFQGYILFFFVSLKRNLVLCLTKTSPFQVPGVARKFQIVGSGPNY